MKMLVGQALGTLVDGLECNHRTGASLRCPDRWVAADHFHARRPDVSTCLAEACWLQSHICFLLDLCARAGRQAGLVTAALLVNSAPGYGDAFTQSASEVVYLSPDIHPSSITHQQTGPENTAWHWTETNHKSEQYTDTGTTNLFLHRQLLEPRTVGCEAASHRWALDHQTARSSQSSAAAHACLMGCIASKAFSNRLVQPDSHSLPVLIFEGCTCSHIVTACRPFLSYYLTTRLSL